MITHIASVICVFSISQNTNSLPQNTLMIDYILRTAPNDKI